MAELQCLRCGAKMEFSGREKFQLGEESYFSGVMAVMTSDSALMDVYTCPDCGKIEFFRPWARQKMAPAAKNWTCSQCGTYNLGKVQNCQGCGVTRAWSDQQSRKE